MVNSYKRDVNVSRAGDGREGQVPTTTEGVIQSVLIQWKDGSYEADSSHY